MRNPNCPNCYDEMKYIITIDRRGYMESVSVRQYWCSSCGTLVKRADWTPVLEDVRTPKNFRKRRG